MIRKDSVAKLHLLFQSQGRYTQQMRQFQPPSSFFSDHIIIEGFKMNVL